MFKNQNYSISQSNSESNDLNFEFNENNQKDQIVYRKDKQIHYEKSSTRLTVPSNQISRDGSSSKLNSKSKKNIHKINRKKRSSLEPLIDKSIDPRRKSIENLFYKLYLNQVHGEELTDLEISNVINKTSISKKSSLSSIEINEKVADHSSNKNSLDNHLITSVKSENESTDKVRSTSAVDNQILEVKNLTKNMSKMSCNNLNNDLMINSNGVQFGM